MVCIHRQKNVSCFAYEGSFGGSRTSPVSRRLHGIINRDLERISRDATSGVCGKNSRYSVDRGPIGPDIVPRKTEGPRVRKTRILPQLTSGVCHLALLLTPDSRIDARCT